MLNIMYNYALDRSAVRDRAELRALKKLCVEMCITVYGKRKEELVAAFMETPATEISVDERADKTLPGAEPVELVGIMMQMMREQMQWMADQQRRQEESQRKQEVWMLAQQEALRQLWEGMRAHQEGGRTAAEEARRVARTPKPMLQKFMDMFESCSTGVAQGDMGYTIGWFIVCMVILLTAILLSPQIGPAI